MRQSLRFGLLIVILISAVLSQALEAQTLSGSLLKRAELVYTRTNIGIGTYTNVRVFIGIPQSLPEQVLYSIAWTPQPTSIVIDAYGQPIAEFLIGTVEPGETVTIRMEVVGSFSRIEWDIIPSSVGELSDIPGEIAALYTIDGDYYHISDPLIVSTSASVLGGETNPYRMAVLIHDYVAETLSYESDGIWDDAVTVLNRGTGSCSEYTFLFIALSRAAGLPARFAGGSRCRILVGESLDQSGHRWAEIYLPNYGWIPFDAQADDVPPGMEATDFGVAAHAHAMITVRGGGGDSTYMSIQYIARARWSGLSTWERDWNVTWTDGSIPGTAAVFRVDDEGNVLADQTFYAAAFESGAADIAEWVPISTPVEPGDVVEFDPIAPGHYRITQSPFSSLVAGVISTTPGVTLGTDLDASEKALLALVGIVPVKVTDEGGAIQPGDLLVTSSTPGHAMRWAGSEPWFCSLVGKALESMDEEQGVILVLLTAH